MSVTLLIETDQPDRIAEAAACQQALADMASPMSADQIELELAFTDDRVELRSTVSRGAKPKPLYVDFLSREMDRRVQQTGRKSLLARALSVPKASACDAYLILDATAGLGRDAWLLAAMGCPVLALERHPVMAAMLSDGLRRARAAPHPAAARITLIATDAMAYLNRQEPPLADVQAIYLDPMFPDHGASAQVKKPMQFTRQILDHDPDSDELFAAARSQHVRLAIKRHAQSPSLGKCEPNLIMRGNSVRYDVYLP